MMQLGRKDVIGLDIGTNTVKLVQLTRDRKDWIVAAAGVVEIDQKGSNSPSRHENNIQKAIRNCFSISGTRNIYAVCAVGGPDVAVRRYRELVQDEKINVFIGGTFAHISKAMNEQAAQSLRSMATHVSPKM